MKFMKIFTALMITALVAFAAFQVNSKEAQPTQASASSKLILEPQGDIQNLVMDQLEEGRWELVMFWATYCPVCKTDFEKLAAFIEENPDLPFTVVGVVLDGDQERDKAIQQINDRHLNYTHVITDFEQGQSLYKKATDSQLIGVPSQLLYNKDNKLVGFSRNAIDIEALELSVYDEE